MGSTTAHQCVHIERTMTDGGVEMRDPVVPKDTPDQPFDADPLLFPPPMVPDTKATTGGLEWLGDLQRTVEEQPTDLGERLTPGERERLQRVVGRVTRDRATSR